MCATVNDIRKSFIGLRVEKKLRHREIADFLELTEAELIDAHVGVSKLDVVRSSPNVAKAIRLRKSWPEIIKLIEGLGQVMALTRNHWAVHEKIGQYDQVSLQGDIGLVAGHGIDLRLFYRQWEFAYIFEEGKQSTLQKSIQFFDEFGQAVHKIFLLPESQHAHLDFMAQQLADSNQEPGILIHERRELTISTEEKLKDIDREALKAHWEQLQDTHEFFNILKKFNLNRLEALILVGHGYAQLLDKSSVKFLLDSAAHLDIPLTIYVGNRGAVQVYAGLIKHVVDSKDWLNILDPTFNFHLKVAELPSVWLVRKPSKDGVITSMEILDAAGEVIAMIFGERLLGQSESEQWRNLLESCKDGEVAFA
jgi:putative hemin transport protein